MGKSYAATKRDVRLFHTENVSNLKDNNGKKYLSADANWKLSRHPYKKKKFTNDPFRHTFGSPKHMNRLVEKKNKQMERQIARNKRRQEFREILNEENETRSICN